MTQVSENTTHFDIEDMIRVTKRLSELLSDDLSHLKTMRIGKLDDTHQEKLQLASLLEGYKNALKADPSLLKTLSQEALVEARNEAKVFEERLGQSQQQLYKAQVAHQSVLELIRSVVREHAAPVRGYQPNGNFPSHAQNHVYTPPINLDERI